MKKYCHIEIPDEVTMEEFKHYIDLWLMIIRNGHHFMKLNKSQKELMKKLHESMKNAKYEYK